MRILYFTDGAGIDLLSIRSSLLRVPEVLSSLRETQKNVRYVDLMTVMSLEESEFVQSAKALRSLLINACQKGLHQRWVNRGYSPDIILRRINYPSFNEVKNDITKHLNEKLKGPIVEVEKLQLIHLIKNVEITIIGPGYDEIEIWLRREVGTTTDLSISVKDIIDSDPALNWFWPQVSQNFQTQIFA